MFIGLRTDNPVQSSDPCTSTKDKNKDFRVLNSEKLSQC